MKKNSYELKLTNTINNLPIISDFVNDALTQFALDAATINRIQLVVDEACTNVINYAYSEEGTGLLYLKLEYKDQELIITLKDWGKPFDPNTIPPPDLSLDVEDRKIGGLGIYFIKNIMDDINYQFDNGCNNLVLKKKIATDVSRN